MILRSNRNDRKIPCGHRINPHMAWEPHILIDSAGPGVLAERTRTTMKIRTMRSGSTGHSVALDHTLKATPLCNPADVNGIPNIESGYRELLTFGKLKVPIEAKFLEMPTKRQVLPLKLSTIRLRQTRGLLTSEAELNGIVSLTIARSLFCDNTGPHLNDGHR